LLVITVVFSESWLPASALWSRAECSGWELWCEWRQRGQYKRRVLLGCSWWWPVAGSWHLSRLPGKSLCRNS